MRQSDDLFQLIKSLQKNEKGHFKKFTSIHIKGEKNQYMQVFEAIEKQDKYDEHLLIASLKGIPDKNFPVIKNYLYHLILKSLRNYYSSHSIQAQLLEDLQNIEVLFDRKLYQQALKLTERAKVKARKYQNLRIHLELNRWERKIYTRFSIWQWLNDRALANKLSNNEILKQIEDINLLESFLDDIRNVYIDKGKRISPEDFQQIKNIYESAVLSEDKRTAAYEANYIYYQILAEYHFIKFDWNNYYQVLFRNIQFLEAHMDITLEEPNLLITGYGNMLLVLTKLNKKDEFRFYLDKIRALPALIPGSKRSQTLESRILLISYKHEIIKSLASGEVQEAVEIIRTNESMLLEAIKADPPYMQIFYAIFANSAFYTNNFHRSLYWINRILKETNPNIGYSHYVYRIIKLIIHYELNDQDLILYLIKDTYRFLYRGNRVYKFETIILNFIRRKLTKNLTPKELREAFRELRSELEQLRDDPFETRVFEYFDFLAWLDTKLDRISIPEAIRRRFPENKET